MRRWLGTLFHMSSCPELRLMDQPPPQRSPGSVTEKKSMANLTVALKTSCYSNGLSLSCDTSVVSPATVSQSLISFTWRWNQVIFLSLSPCAKSFGYLVGPKGKGPRRHILYGRKLIWPKPPGCTTHFWVAHLTSVLFTFLWPSRLVVPNFKGTGKCHSTVCLGKEPKISGEQHEWLLKIYTVMVNFMCQIGWAMVSRYVKYLWMFLRECFRWDLHLQKSVDSQIALHNVCGPHPISWRSK